MEGERREKGVKQAKKPSVKTIRKKPDQRKNIETLRKLMVELPTLCFEFFTAIEPRTGILTRIGYARDLRMFFTYLADNHPEFADRKPAEITLDDLRRVRPVHIEMFLEYLNLYWDQNDLERTNENAGKKRKLCALRTFFRYLLKHQYLESNPAAVVDTPPIREKPIVRLEPSEVSELLESVERGDRLTKHESTYHRYTRLRDLAIISLLLGTGIRISECIGLNRSDIDFDNRSFRIIRKGGNESILYFSGEVETVLRDYAEVRKAMQPRIGHEDAFFLSMQNRRITARAVQNLVSKYAQRVTPLKHITPHKFRSTYGTELYKKTGDIYLVADILGHKDVNTTRRHYADMIEERRKAAAEAVRLREDKKT